MYLQCTLQLSLYVVQFGRFTYTQTSMLLDSSQSPGQKTIQCNRYDEGPYFQQFLVLLERVQTSSGSINVARIPLMGPAICRSNFQATKHQTAHRRQAEATSTHTCSMARLLLRGLAALYHCVPRGITWMCLNIYKTKHPLCQDVFIVPSPLKWNRNQWNVFQKWIIFSIN